MPHTKKRLNKKYIISYGNAELRLVSVHPSHELNIFMIFVLSDYLFKMLIIGNSGVGKSCLLLRYADN